MLNDVVDVVIIIGYIIIIVVVVVIVIVSNVPVHLRYKRLMVTKHPKGSFSG